MEERQDDGRVTELDGRWRMAMRDTHYYYCMFVEQEAVHTGTERLARTCVCTFPFERKRFG